MTNQQNQKHCAHPGCNCTVPQDEEWCSPHCETAPIEAICGCGHAECAAGAPAESMPAAGT